MSLTLTQLVHRYPPINPTDAPRTILEIDDWTLSAGDQVLLRGVSGSGKTTLLNIIAGLLRPSGGTVTVNGQSLYALSEAARDRFRAGQIGYIFQTHHLLAGLTALENVEMPLAFAGVGDRERHQKAEALLARMGLADHRHYRPKQLSVGQRARVAVARALASTPKVLLADEPTAALDPETAQNVMSTLYTLCAEHRIILLIASHDPALTESFPPERTYTLDKQPAIRFQRSAAHQSDHLLNAETH
jgi:putative ABC transport system ATP-binding protein